MEVVLKKTKITSSILKQALRSTKLDLTKGETLGWCVFEKRKYMVCYRSDIKCLTKFPVFTSIKAKENYNEEVGEKTYTMTVFFENNFPPLDYFAGNEPDKFEMIEILEKAKAEAINKGQFFI